MPGRRGNIRNLLPHDRIRRRLDLRFRSIRRKYAGQMQCGRGCARCCHGLFDISTADATRVAGGYMRLPEPAKTEVKQRAAAIQERLRAAGLISPPYLLDRFTEEQIDELVELAGDVRCPFLDGRDACLIYENRPVQCLLEGIPMVDVQDGLFGDWCELNFSNGLSAEMMHDMRIDYYELEELEQSATVFIPSVVCAPGYWSPW